MEFSRQECWSGLPLPPLGIFLTQGSNPCLLGLLHWQADSFPLSRPGISHISSWPPLLPPWPCLVPWVSMPSVCQLPHVDLQVGFHWTPLLLSNWLSSLDDLKRPVPSWSPFHPQQGVLCTSCQALQRAVFPFWYSLSFSPGVSCLSVCLLSLLCAHHSLIPKLSARVLKFLSSQPDSSGDVFIPFSSETSCLEPGLIFQSRLVAPEAGCYTGSRNALHHHLRNSLDHSVLCGICFFPDPQIWTACV